MRDSILIPPTTAWTDRSWRLVLATAALAIALPFVGMVTEDQTPASVAPGELHVMVTD
jgi:hypothetical protein